MEEAKKSSVEESNESQPGTSNGFQQADNFEISQQELEEQPVISDDFAALVKNMEEEDQLEEEDDEPSTANPEWCDIKISDDEASSSVREETTPKGKPHRRKRGRKRYKPFHKMNQQEKNLAKDSEFLKRNKRQLDMLSSGHPVAPNNTTQYIMSMKTPPVYRDIKTDHLKGMVYEGTDSPVYKMSTDLDDVAQHCLQSFDEMYEEESQDCQRRSRKTQKYLVDEYLSKEREHKQLENELSRLREAKKASLEKFGFKDGDDIEKCLEEAREKYEKAYRENKKLKKDTSSVVLPWDSDYHYAPEQMNF